jgi:hypothetical protein
LLNLKKKILIVKKIEREKEEKTSQEKLGKIE